MSTSQAARGGGRGSSFSGGRSRGRELSDPPGFGTDDRAAEVERLERAGASVVETKEGANLTFTILRDPEGTRSASGSPVNQPRGGGRRAGRVITLAAPALQGRRMLVIQREVERAPDGSVPAELRRLIQDPVLQVSIQSVLPLATGLLALMVLKPSLVGALLIMGDALLFGVVSALTR